MADAPQPNPVRQPEIVETYGDPRTPSGARVSVEDFLASAPRKSLRRLDLIHLRDLASLKGGERREKVVSRSGRVAKNRVKGLYRAPSRSEGAQIELFVDQIFRGLPRWSAKVPILRNLLVASVLSHELGHHLYETRAGASHEAVADSWRSRLLKGYARQRYPWLIRHSRWVGNGLKLIRRLSKTLGSASRRSGSS